MTNEFISALERIVETEKNKAVQEKTITVIQSRINSLGKAANIEKPVLRQTSYNVEAVYQRTPDTPEFGVINGGCSIICGILGALIGSPSIINAVVYFFVGGAIGLVLGLVLTPIVNIAIKISTEADNKQKIDEAQTRAKIRYEQEQENAKKQYELDVGKYNAQVAADHRRVACEEQQKRVLENVLAGLKEKHSETETCLKQFYEKAGIYDTYRNLIAVSYFIEYFKSGICTELGGRDGAYLIFKDEMYKQYMIERLDTIISKLEQIHFDNTVLNATLESVGDKVHHLSAIAADVKSIQLDNSARIDQLGSQLSSAAQRLLESNRVIAYNQECTKQELANVEWFERMNYYFKQ